MTSTSAPTAVHHLLTADPPAGPPPGGWVAFGHDEPPAAPPGPPPSRPDRSGAAWVTAAGAALLLAAATTFVAVRWDHLASWQKFGALVVVTQALIVGGWFGRRRVPTTAAAVFSLGVVLVPLDAWTLAASTAGGWRHGLLAAGALGVVAFPVARRLLDTAALRWAATAALPLAAAGAAATFGGPPPAVVLAVAGLAATVAGRRRDAVAWTLLAAVAPVATLVAPTLSVGAGVLADLGLTGSVLPWTTAAAALVVVAAAVVDRGRLAGPAGPVAGPLLAVADLAAALHLAHSGVSGWALALAAVWVGVEVAALAAIDDAFWSPRSRAAAQVAEAVGVAAAGMGVACVPFGRLGDAGVHAEVPLPTPAATSVAAALAVVAWLLADVREGRRLGRRGWSSILTGPGAVGPATAVAAFAALAVATSGMTPLAVAGAYVVLGAVLVATRRAGATALGPALAAVAALIGAGAWGSAAMLPALVVMVVGVRRADDHGRADGTDPDGWLAVFGSCIVAAVLTAGALTDAFVRESWPHLTEIAWWGALPVAVAGSAAVRRHTKAGLPLWALSILTLMVAGVHEQRGTGTAAWAVLVTATLGVLAAETAVRRSTAAGVLAGLASPMATIGVLAVADLDAGDLALGLAAGAALAVGALLLDQRNRRRCWATAAATHLAVGVVLSMGWGGVQRPVELGAVVLTAGVLMLAVAFADRSVPLGANGTVVALLGAWATLAGGGVDVPEAYLAPLALALWAAGAVSRHGDRRVSSWVAYTPALVTLAVPAYVQRLDGGPGWHAVLAGAVAVAAVAVGAWRRLAAPLFVGSAVLVAVTVTETLTRTAGVPTWIWLTAGGVVLLGAGIGMELRGLGPVESGRRVVALVAERFE